MQQQQQQPLCAFRDIDPPHEHCAHLGWASFADASVAHIITSLVVPRLRLGQGTRPLLAFSFLPPPPPYLCKSVTSFLPRTPSRQVIALLQALKHHLLVLKPSAILWCRLVLDTTPDRHISDPLGYYTTSTSYPPYHSFTQCRETYKRTQALLLYRSATRPALFEELNTPTRAAQPRSFGLRRRCRRSHSRQLIPFYLSWADARARTIPAFRMLDLRARVPS